MADNIPVWWNNRYQLYKRNGTMTNVQKIAKLHLTPYTDSDLQLTTSQPIFRQLILYNYTDFPQVAAEDYIETLHKQSLILHRLGLSTTQADTQRTFASNVVEQGLFSFLAGEIPSFYQLWVFAVCAVVTAVIVMKITSFCCIKPCVKRNKARYQQFAILVEQSAIGQRFNLKKSQPNQDDRDIEMQSQAI